MAERMTDPEAIRRLVHSVKWFHTFEVAPGVKTPGQSEVNAPKILDTFGVAADLRGVRALDIGTWDGAAAFELEARGATVSAMDVQHPDHTGFNVARRIRGSAVRYVQGSVYDLGTLFPCEQFDLVYYFGVFYHLKHPILGFEQIADMLAPTGKLYFEGEVFLKYAETIDGEPACIDARAVAEARVPLALCYAGDYKGASNWFIPNVPCLEGWVQAAGLTVTHEWIRDWEGTQRLSGIAVRSENDLKVEETPVFEAQLEMPAGYWIRMMTLRDRRRREPVRHWDRV